MPEKKVEKDFFSAKYFQKQLGNTRGSGNEYQSKYNDKVLIGNWMENNFSYVKKVQPIVSSYQKDYPTRIQPANYDNYYENKVRGWGTKYHTVFDQGSLGQYNNVFSTLYDRSYNNPNLTPATNKYRRNKLSEDSEKYENTNNYGLRDVYMKKWREDTMCDIHESPTTNTQVYIEKELPKYTGRRSSFRALSSSFSKITTDNANLNPRNKKLTIIPEHPTGFPVPLRKPKMILPSL